MMTRTYYHRLGQQRGLSLIELMVAMAIGLVLLGALASLYVANSKARSEFSKTSAQVENGRFAIQSIERDVAMSGFFGKSGMVRLADTYSTPDLCVTSLAAAATPTAITKTAPLGSYQTSMGFSPAPAAGNPMPTLIVPTGIYGLPINAATPACLNGYNVAPNSEILVVRYASGDPTPADGSNYFLQLSQCSVDSVPFVFDRKTGAFQKLQKLACNGALAETRQYVVRIYFLSTCDNCTPSDNIPTLKVLELSKGNWTAPSSLVEGIQDIHYSYGVDMDGNGSPDCYVDDPAIDNSASCPAVPAFAGWADVPSNWANVTAVRISVLSRSPDFTVGWQDTRTYSLGRTTVDGGQTMDGPFNDNYKRHVYSTLARIWNTGGMREIP